MTNRPISLTSDSKKVRDAVLKIEKGRASKFAEIVNRAYNPNPAKKDIQTVQRWLDDYPEIWCLVFDLSQFIEKNLVVQISPNPVARLALEKNLEEIRQKLGYENGTALEVMLIDDIIRCWLR